MIGLIVTTMKLRKGEHNMKKISITKSVIVGLSLSFITMNSFGGIPVTDAIAIANQKAEFIEKALHWTSQLREAASRLEQLQDQTESMTGFKGIATELQETVLKQATNDSFDKILDGDFSGVTDALKNKYLSSFNVCDLSDDEAQASCNELRERSVASISHIKEANTVLSQMQTRLNTLSQQIKNTTDLKGIAELQTALDVDAQSIQLLAAQTSNFLAMQTQADKLASRKLEDNYFAKATANLEKAKLSSSLSSEDSESSLDAVLGE
jgi:hypothetical protein